MSTLLKYELKSGIKNFLIWTLAVGGIGLVCIALYKGMQDSMVDMAASFAQMGAFADAFGMSSLSIATLEGYFATEIGTIHALGGGLFAASIATVILSKEEDAHTAEFTFTLPVSRGKVVIGKFIAVIINLLLFSICCTGLYQIGFMIVGENTIGKEFIIYMAMQLVMEIEIAAICFVISAVSKKNKLGIGIGVAMVLYIYDIMSRVIPKLEDVKFISPYSYANATDIFVKADANVSAIVLGIVVIVAGMAAAGIIYTRRDLAS